MISLSPRERLLDSTVNILTGLLNAEPYSAVIVTLFRRGDELLKELQQMESTQEIEEMTLRWNTVMSLLEQSIANEEMSVVCCRCPLVIPKHEVLCTFSEPFHIRKHGVHNRSFCVDIHPIDSLHSTHSFDMDSTTEPRDVDIS